MPPRRSRRRACNACRQQKKRCSGKQPCMLCERLSKTCVFRDLSSGNEEPVHSRDNTVGEYRETSLLDSSRNLSPATTDANSEDLPPYNDASLFEPYQESCPNERVDFTSPGGEMVGKRMIGMGTEAQDLYGIDTAGNLLEPASPYSWLRRALVRLGSIKTHMADHPASNAKPNTSIFSHGDSASGNEQCHPLGPGIADISSASISWLHDSYFERAMATYHFLHAPTIKRWLDLLRTSDGHDLLPQQRCIALLVLSHGALYLLPDELAQIAHYEGKPVSSESFYHLAMRELDCENGRPTLESVQSRLLQVHHLLSSSRPNQAWYLFGTVVQLMWALGLHRATNLEEVQLDQQLRRRTFWCIYATDKYISIALGRPVLIRDESVSQKIPMLIDDDDLGTETTHDNTQRDCTLGGTIQHILLSKIVAQGISEQNETSFDSLVKAVGRNQKALDSWKASLPPLLSGQVHSSSLIPKFRRQAVVLRTFYLNAVILINRPLLVYHPVDEPNASQIQASVQICLEASKALALQIVQFCKEAQRAEIYWFTQSITFNAISILYFYLLRNLQLEGALSDENMEIYHLAHDAYLSLQKVTQDNAPTFRYCLVLDELRKEIQYWESIGSKTLKTPTADGLLGPSTSLEIQPSCELGSPGDLMRDVFSSSIHGPEHIDGSFWPWFNTLSTSW